MTTTERHTGKIHLASIEITQSEGIVRGIFPTYEAVDLVLRTWAETGHCCKVWFTVRWADGETHEGRVDVMPWDAVRGPIVGAHLRDFYAFNCLRRLAPGYTLERQAALLKTMRVTEEQAADCAKRLDTYELGVELTPAEQADEDAAVAIWKAAEKVRDAAASQKALEATWWTGDLYDSAATMGDRSRRIRADLTALARSTPSALFGCRFRVTTLGSSVYVYVTPPSCPNVVSLARARAEATNPHGFNREPRWTMRGQAILAAVEAAGNRHNFDKSDRGRGHDYTREAFAMHADFAAGVESTVWEEARRAVATVTQP